MLNRNHFSLLFILIYSLFNSQSIKGKISNEDHYPVSYSEVVLSDTSKKKHITVTKENGEYEVKLPNNGMYLLEVLQQGELVYKKEVSITNTTLLDIVLPYGKTKQIEEITLTGKKKLIELKADRLVFNVQNSIMADGGDALDVLAITPRIEATDQGISMIGKSGVKIMINGRMYNGSGESLLMYLKSLPSSDIERIEVISSPPAKYSAEGQSGLVNIVLKKARNNYFGGGFTTSYQQGYYGKPNSSVNLMYKKDKLSLYSTLNYNNGLARYKDYTEIHYPDALWISNTIDKAVSDNKSGRIGMDYDVTKKLQLGVLYNGSFNKSEVEDENLSFINKNIGREKNTTLGTSERKNKLHSFNFHTIYKIDSLGKKISFDFDYLSFNSKRERTSLSETELNGISSGVDFNQNNSNQDVNSYSFNIDVEHPMKWLDLNYGARSFISKTENDLFANLSGLPIQNDLFEYKEYVNALFVSATKKINEKLEVQMGLRYENTDRNGISKTLHESNKNNRSDFFPTVFLSYQPKENHSFSINYNRRIMRPGFSSLNPFKWYSTPYTSIEGNPNLSPILIDNFEFNHLYKDILHSALSYEMARDNFGGVFILDDSSYQQNVYQLNYYDYSSFALSETLVYKKKWYQGQFGGYVVYQKSDSKIYPLTPKSYEGFIYGLGANNQFSLSKKTKLGFNISHKFPSNSADLVHNKSRTMLSFYFRTVISDQFNVSVNFNNILKEYNFNTDSYRNNNFTISQGYYDTRYVRLSLNYTFGKKLNIKEAKAKNSEIQNRVH